MDNSNLPEKMDENNKLEQSVRQVDRITAYVPRKEDKSSTEFGKQWFYILFGFSIFILVATFSWWFLLPQVTKDGGQTPTQDVQYETTRDRVIVTDEPIWVGVESRQNDVTLRVNSVTPRSRYTLVDVTVINNGTTPVSFMGLLDAQLIDDEGNPLPIDFQSAQGFIVVNPGTQMRGQLRFMHPIRKEAKSLTLVVNNVGTLQNRWYYELKFPLR